MRRATSIPTIVGLLLLVVGVGIGVMGIKKGQTWFTGASPEEQPRETRITNLTDRGFVISWISDTPVRGFVKYGDVGGSLPDVAFDSRDKAGESQGEYPTHYVEITGLKPNTLYEFKIGSGKKLYDNSGKAFSVRTGQALQTPVSGTDLVSGSVVTSGSGVSPVGAIVYMETPTLVPLSAIVKSGGTYTIPLSGARTRDLSGVYEEFADGEILELLVEGGSLGRATATVNVKNRDSVPPISIPGDYDFSMELPRDESGAIILPGITPGLNTAPAGTSPTPLPGSKFSLESLPTPTESDEVTVLYPTALETVEVANPEIQGTAPPGKTLTITVQTTPQSQQVVSDANGDWSFTPLVGLEPGEHTLTISYVDKTGTLKKIVRKFTVAPTAGLATQQSTGGDDMGFTASPSATLTPTPTSLTPTLTGTITPTPTSLTPTLTGTITPTPTAAATPTVRAGLPATESGVPVAGNFDLTLGLIVIGLMLIGGGVLVKGMVREEKK